MTVLYTVEVSEIYNKILWILEVLAAMNVLYTLAICHT